jgi:acetyl esterase/lipase
MDGAGSDVIVDKDLAYATAERPLLWDTYRLRSTPSGAPVVMLLHGGGWRFGERSMMAAAATEFACRGYVAVAPEYRLLGEAPWPTPLDDVRRAIGAVRGGAIAGASAGPVYLAGYSAGAHLALLAAAVARQAVAGIAAFFPPARLGPRHAAPLGFDGDADLAPLSPITHAAHLPPTILFCGDADAMTPVEQSIELHSAIRAAGGTSDLRIFSDLVHEFVSLPGLMETTVRDAAEFFDRTSLAKPAFDEALEELRQWWDKLMSRPPADAS